MKAVELIGMNSVCIKIEDSDKVIFGYKPIKELGILVKATEYNDFVYVEIYTMKGYQATYIPKLHNVEIETSKDAHELFIVYEEYVIKQLHTQLGHTFSIGSDPEIFVTDENDIIIPAFDFLASKESKKTRSPDRIYGNLPVYWDGFQAEFETSAQGCLGWHTDSVQLGLEGVLQHALKYHKKAKLTNKTTIDIPQDVMDKASPEHTEFGCMPSLNIYGLEGMKVSGREVPFRSAGGHIHFGVGKIADARISKMVKALDAILGVACVSMFASFDDPRRRTMYGLAGEYRLPPHGLEYRTLSNAWLCHPLIMNLVFDFARKVLVFGDKGLMHLWNSSEEETIRIIQEHDVEAARQVLKNNKDIVIAILRNAYATIENATLAYNVYLNGIESAVTDPSDIKNNWDLNVKWTEHSNGIGKCFCMAKEILNNNKKVS